MIYLIINATAPCCHHAKEKVPVSHYLDRGL